MCDAVKKAEQIAKEVARLGGRAYYVGGYVRDALLKRENKDVDIEVHGITPEVLGSVLESVGHPVTFGKSFGIYALKDCSLDIALPRKERVTGKGHRDFDIFVDPFIGTKKAAQRRDFTVNALMQDVLTGEVIDHFGGMEDLQKGILSHVDDQTFAEDPLRVFRGAQFAARFEFSVAPETVSLCQTIDVRFLSRERVFEELSKALLKAKKPSLFFETLKEMGQLFEWFSPLEQLIGIEQNKKYHLEGDVWTHTMMVLDCAASCREQTNNPLGFMLLALTHDFGKITATKEVKGELHAYNHEQEGLPLIDSFLRRLTNETALIQYVLNLAEMHMEPNRMAAANSSVKATNKLFDLAKDPADLIRFAACDSLGKITKDQIPDWQPFLWERLNIFEEYMERPYVTGKDLIHAGLLPTEHFSEILSYAHKLRLAGIQKESALKQTISFAKKITS